MDRTCKNGAVDKKIKYFQISRYKPILSIVKVIEPKITYKREDGIFLKTKKMVMALLMAVSMCVINAGFTAPIECKASMIQPLWVNVSNVSAGLSFSGSKANCSAMVQGAVGTTKITATITLERKTGTNSYTTVKTWPNQSVSGSFFTFSDSYTVTAGYTYRLTVTANVTRNGTTETVSNWIERAN